MWNIKSAIYSHTKISFKHLLAIKVEHVTAPMKQALFYKKN